MTFNLSSFLGITAFGTIVTTGILSLTPAANACGPDFPNRYFDAPAAQIMAAPEAFFGREVARIAGCETHSPSNSGASPSTTDSDDRDELLGALLAQGIAKDKAAAIAAHYAKLRAGLESTNADRLRAELPPEVPEEFALYLLGAQAYRKGDLAMARKEWQSLLALPEAERRHRSTWAAYMLGRIAETPECGTAYFAKTRELSASGFADSQNLSAASWGWEAKHYLDNDRLNEAANLYLRHYQAGAPSALNSISVVMNKASRDTRYYDAETSVVHAFAKDANSRRLWTAYLLSRSTDRYYWDDVYRDSVADACREWVKILKLNDIRSIDESQHFAWIAYKGGYIQLAKEWLTLAPKGQGEAEWIRAKIALQEGNLPAATLAMEAAIASPQMAGYLPLLYAELGRIYLAQDKREVALGAWLRGQHWEDAAYIAERVLTPDELIEFVDNQLDPLIGYDEASVAQADGKSSVAEISASAADEVAADYKRITALRMRNHLRELLARRLMREGRVETALTYFSDDTRPAAERYVALVQSAYDTKHSAEDRAGYFWESAQLTRNNGMRVFGTELYPDGFIWGGSFPLDDEASLRRKLALYERGPLAPTAAELKRLSENKTPDKRFHYRYRAAQLGGWAAALLPNDSDQTANILYTSGSWLKVRDPQAAEPFYQALVIRCPHTELGKAAADLKWFPPENTADISKNSRAKP